MPEQRHAGNDYAAGFRVKLLRDPVECDDMRGRIANVYRQWQRRHSQLQLQLDGTERAQRQHGRNYHQQRAVG